jgi:hypothetical protein
MPTINEIIAALQSAQTRVSVAEIDLLDTPDITEQQQSTLINLLIDFSQYRRPRSQEDTSPPKNPHHVKILKLKNFLITYAQMLEIINSGLEIFWLVNCKISFEENLTGRFVLEKFSIGAESVFFEKTFDKSAIYVPKLRQKNEMQHLKLEECTELPNSYLFYLRFHLALVEICRVENILEMISKLNTTEEMPTIKKPDRQPRSQNHSPEKQLTRQAGCRNLKFKISSSSNSSSSLSTTFTSTPVTSTENVLTDRSSTPESPKSFSASSSFTLLTELPSDNPEDIPQDFPPTTRL